jgi:hypothetical protein
MDDEQKPATPNRSWLQISLRTLLALVLGFGAGLAVRYQFDPQPERLPDPSGIRRGDKLAIELGSFGSSARTVLVLADGTVTLPYLGQVPAAGLSSDTTRTTESSIPRTPVGRRSSSLSSVRLLEIERRFLECILSLLDQGMVAHLALRLIGRSHELSYGVKYDCELPVVFLLQLVQAPSQLLVTEQHLP